jgi:sugar (pentulose or hexulose) kinase
MDAIATIAVFDIGKTNKKLLLFDEQYHIVYEESTRLQETTDEDGFPCEDINALTAWVKTRFTSLVADQRFDIRAVNFSGYGASLVYIDEEGNPLLPLYNYLKPYPENLSEKFYGDYGGRSLVCRQTASPALGSLNSGLQLYRLKYERPDVFNNIKYALHLPQYLSYILSGSCHSELTSIGCHTHLWDFEKNRYHHWVINEGLAEKFPGIRSAADVAGNYDGRIKVGMGLHDSSSALIPYISSFSGPFVLLSTGTWCISLNPFNHDPLTDDELQQDCLCFLSFQGMQVKASRLFAGYEHEQEVKRIAEHFKKPVEHFAGLKYSKPVMAGLKNAAVMNSKNDKNNFGDRDLQSFGTYREAYHQLMSDIVTRQRSSTNLVLGNVKRIFVDGGFSRNQIFMHLLSEAFPGMEVYAASVSQASALGAALVMHDHWNEKTKPSDLIEMTLYMEEGPASTGHPSMENQI